MDELTKLDKEKDSIKTVHTDKDGRVETVVFKDGNTLQFNDFIALFKTYLRTIIAGEIVSFDDVWRFHNQTDAKGMEDFLTNVELEGEMKGSRLTLTKGQKIGLGVLIIIIVVIALAFMIVASVLK